jgi:F-type H+-transporting ATPase subunit epsilon
MARLNVEITTPEKRIVQMQADEAIVPGAEGLFGVRPGHTPFLSVVEPGALTIRDGSDQQIWFVAGGFVEVNNDTVRVLADQAESIASIDVDACKKLVEEAQARLKGLSTEDARYQIESATVKRETVRMAVARR